MFAYLRDRKTFRALRKAAVLSSALVEDALTAENSTVTVVGTEIGNDYVGFWVEVDGMIFALSSVRPQADRTLLTLSSPLEVFSRQLELPYALPPTVGGFAAQVLQDNWVDVNDPEYAMPYLRIVNTDTTARVLPDLDSNGLFSLPVYLRAMRSAYDVAVHFRVDGFVLVCSIAKFIPTQRQVSFSDGRSQLTEVIYAADKVAKLSVIQDVDTGSKDADGNAILQRNRSTWYLAEDGSVSTLAPPRRSDGKWNTLIVGGKDDVRTKVVEAFAKNKFSHKLVFYSRLDLAVGDPCRFMVYGKLLESRISYKSRLSTDNRYLYKSGELAATATEKLKGALKK